MEPLKKRVTTLCYAAGQSGGHIIPCLTLAAQMHAETPETRILFFSSNSAVDQQIVPRSALVDHHIPLSLSHRRSWLTILRLVWATVTSVYILLTYKPKRIISTGGIVALPVCIAGWLLRIPIDLYELNAVPGKAIRMLTPLATHLFVCFAAAKKYVPRAMLTQYPIRFDRSRERKRSFSFAPDRLTIFVQGGSQGSQQINKQIRLVIETYPDLHNQIQLIHQTGADTSTDWNAFYNEHTIPTQTFAYDHDMAPYYEQADLVICRAGAGALFETIHFQKQCITIPLETTRNTHQLDNARAMATEYPQLVTMIRQGDDLMEKLYEIIKKGTGKTGSF